jgi:hypothetical protein
MSLTSRPAMASETRPTTNADALTPAETAWIAVLPCALLLLGAILLLSKPIGALLFPTPRNEFWPAIAGQVRPEPTEHMSYLFAIASPLLLSAAVVAGSVPRLRPAPRMRRGLVRSGQAALAVFAIVCVVAQERIRFGFVYLLGPPAHRAYFTPATLAFAVAMAAVVCLVLRSERARTRAAALLRETPARRAGAAAVAILFTAAWLLTAINVDSSVGNVNPAVHDLLPWSLDETFAILDGRTPLVNFHAQYGELWPYVTAGAMALIGTSLTVYTLLMASITGASMLAVYALLRRMARSAPAALALYLPFLATSFFIERGPLGNRFEPANLFAIFPTRYAGPYLLAWLLVRHVDGRTPRRGWLLFGAAGLVALNNPEFGIPAFGATLAACAWARPPRSRGAALALARDAAAGLVAAAALVCVLTLVHSGSLPDFGLLFEFSKLYGVTGWAMLPMPHLGFHLVMFATLAGAIVVATVRAVRREEDVAFTALLAWTGVFGLGAGVYYAGRSHPEVLIDMFSAWAFALALLVLLAVRAIAARRRPLPTVAEAVLIAVFGLTVCSIAQTPAPWSQIQRLGRTTATPEFGHTPMERFVARETRPGEHVVLLNPVGHRIAYDDGIVNVSPYSSAEAVNTPRQLATTLALLRAAHGRRIFVYVPRTPPELIETIAASGYRPGPQEARGVLELIAETPPG